jgi:hypothetical protein
MNNNIQFSYYRKPIENKKPIKNINCSELFDLITKDESIKSATLKLRGLDSEQKKSFKPSSFDYITPNGTFKIRKAEALIELSGLMILDIDHQLNVESIKERFANDLVLNPVFIFISPNGDGLKVLLPIDKAIIKTGQDKAMSPVCNAVNEYLKQNYSDIITPDAKGNFIDSSGVDVGRACFVCHDPDAYFNPNVEVCINASFLERFTSTSRKPKLNVDCKTKLKVDPIKRFADMKFMKDNNHNTQVVAFAGACVNDFMITEDMAIQYINDHVAFAPESSHFNNASKTESTVKDIFQRYRKQELEEPIRLDKDKFAVDMFYFKKSEKIGYTLHGLYRTGIADYLSSQGYYKRYINSNSSLLIHADGNVIKEVSVEKIKDALSKHIENLDDIAFIYQDESFRIPHESLRNVYYSQSHTIFNNNWLQHLNAHEVPFLKDTEKSSFYAFRNGLVEVASDGISDPVPFDSIGNKCIWESQIIKRDFVNVAHEDVIFESEFSKFISNVCNHDEKRVHSLSSAIGYLLHGHSIPSRTKAVILNDEELTEKEIAMGGTGKGIIGKANMELKPTVKIDGKEFVSGDKFHFQRIEPSTQIAWLDDPKPDFDFSTLYSAITDGLTVERKYLPQIYFEPSESPKWLISSNTALNNSGSSDKRRQYVVEFSNHYSKKIITGNEEPIVEEHKGHFFSDSWSKNEWNLFYNWMLVAVSFYLKNGLADQPLINLSKNRLLQTTEPDFVAWVDDQSFITEKFYPTKIMYADYVSAYNLDSSKFPQKRFSKWIKQYASSVNWVYDSTRSNGTDSFIFKLKK